MLRLSASDPDFDSAFTALVNARREADSDVSRDVAAIVARVRAEGDTALKDYSARFDGHDLDASGWEIGKAERRAALANLDSDLRKAIELAAERIAAYHAARSLTIATIRTRPGFALVRAGPRSMRPAYMCRAAARPIPRPY